MPSLKEGSIVKVDHFEVARCSSMYTITDHPFLIRFISLTIIGEVNTCAPEINLQSRLESSVMNSSLPRIALTIVSGKKKMLFLKKKTRNSRWKLIFLEAPRLQDKSEDRCWWEVDQGNTSVK
ncbi:unnamed protein product [Brassica oleracea]